MFSASAPPRGPGSVIAPSRKNPKSRSGSQTGESRQSSLESQGLISRAQNSLSTVSFFLTRLEGAGSPKRDVLIILIRIVQLIAVSTTANGALVDSAFYRHFFGFIRLDVALLTETWFYALFWVSFALTFIAFAGLRLQFSSLTLPALQDS